MSENVFGDRNVAMLTSGSMSSLAEASLDRSDWFTSVDEKCELHRLVSLIPWFAQAVDTIDTTLGRILVAWWTLAPSATLPVRDIIPNLQGNLF